ncbi:hypothetical protein [Acinetobacter sp. MD2]|uniref:hypothetical protein n=1 Tax=Acinetobacter sp. MD2 TaxID=2600066 RepID=UPI002D1F561F|nr:hypothetical protein [Acinetobacter sp. MD2]MEB3767308.1 hypothetical protein [Acinetobacter sp. MD2]
MNLLEKALLIQDIKKNIQIIETLHLPLFERAKATHRLKEIFQFCEKPIVQKRYQGLAQYYTPQQISHECVKKSDFQNSYRGLFSESSLLLQELNKNPMLGWAILYEQTQKQWQIWVIPQAKKGVIHSSWKEHLDEAYLWLSQQQKLLHCLISDRELSLPTTAVTSTRPETTQETYQKSHSITPTEPATLFNTQQLHLEVLNDNKFSLQLGNLATIFTPIQVPTFSQLNFAVQVEQLAHLDPLFLYLSLSDQVSELLNTPILVAERLNEAQQLMGYVVIFGASQSNAAQQLAVQYCYTLQQRLGTIKRFSWTDWQKNADNLEVFFEDYLQKSVLWQPKQKYLLIPEALLLTQRFIPFEETAADLDTPLILIKERAKYRVIHGASRLNYPSDALGYPCIVLSRQMGLSLQIMRQIIDTLKPPISVTMLHDAIQQYVKK